MTISEDVIKDLLPLYAVNECSAESRRLVEDYLRTHPEAAATIADAARSVLRTPLPAAPGGDLERRALARTQRLLRQKTIMFSFATFFSLMPFSFTFSNGSVSWLLVSEPMHAAVYAAIGTTLWFVYLVARRSLRGSW